MNCTLARFSPPPVRTMRRICDYYLLSNAQHREREPAVPVFFYVYIPQIVYVNVQICGIPYTERMYAWRTEPEAKHRVLDIADQCVSLISSGNTLPYMVPCAIHCQLSFLEVWKNWVIAVDPVAGTFGKTVVNRSCQKSLLSVWWGKNYVNLKLKSV